MKLFSILVGLLFSTAALAQLPNANTLKAKINGEEFQSQPRRIRIGAYWWITANTSKPDQSLRIWLGSYDHTDGIEPGTYLVVDADKADSKGNKAKVQAGSGYKGLAVIKYVKETREPRMEYHVGKSQNNDETVVVKKNADGSLEATFSGVLAGSYWKEKSSATVFGGMGRLMNKMEDKVITKTTGFDSSIDPEGNGYKQQSKKDSLVLTEGTFHLPLPSKH